MLGLLFLLYVLYLFLMFYLLLLKTFLSCLFNMSCYISLLSFLEVGTGQSCNLEIWFCPNWVVTSLSGFCLFLALQRPCSHE